VPSLLLGGVSLAIGLSFPVKLLSRVMPRGRAIVFGFAVLAGLLLLLVAGMVPAIVEQLRKLAQAAPQIARQLDARLPSVLEWLADRGLLSAPPDPFLATLRQDLLAAVQRFTGHLVGSFGHLIGNVIDTVVVLFGMVFIAVYLLADARRFQVAALRATPPRYRRDVRALGTAFGDTLSRYLGGLVVSLAVQGALSALALALLRVPYALLLGAWVAVTALVPFLGAWIGAVPAVMLALTVSPTTALLTGVFFLAIQQLEGNVLTPRLQSQAVRVHPILVVLAVIAGGELAGLAGVVFAVPALAVARVLYDFFRTRLRVAPTSRANLTRRQYQVIVQRYRPRVPRSTLAPGKAG
jgi:predicted PurR-regulated permease PerM